ncbi:hypothetical protein D3C76_1358960 [compost metagenome]
MQRHTVRQRRICVENPVEHGIEQLIGLMVFDLTEPAFAQSTAQGIGAIGRLERRLGQPQFGLQRLVTLPTVPCQHSRGICVTVLRRLFQAGIELCRIALWISAQVIEPGFRSLAISTLGSQSV